MLLLKLDDRPCSFFEGVSSFRKFISDSVNILKIVSSVVLFNFFQDVLYMAVNEIEIVCVRYAITPNMLSNRFAGNYFIFVNYEIKKNLIFCFCKVEQSSVNKNLIRFRIYSYLIKN